MSPLSSELRILSELQPSKALAGLRAAHFRAVPEICIERPLLITRYSNEAGLFRRTAVGVLEKARLYRKVLENREPVVWHVSAYERKDDGMARFDIEDTTPFAGSTTRKFKGVPVYPEFMGLSIWPELRTIARRTKNPYYIEDTAIDELNRNVFPFWIDHSIVELARSRGTNEDRERLQLLQCLVFFLASKPECISHTIPDFSRAIRLGLRAIIEEALERKRACQTRAQAEFYQALAEVLEGIINYAKRIAGAAIEQCTKEAAPNRRRALAEIGRIYARVPEQAASTFREALTTIWLCWTAIHLENPNVGLSLGRLDQVLYESYRRDRLAGVLSLEHAVELLCHFWLKIGDHVPLIPNAAEQLFGGTGSNQAITIGGVDSAGNDAVNELTYLMLRTTELMTLRDPNLNARYYPEVNDESYLRRLCEVNLVTGATPAIHNDRAIIAALTANGETLEQSRDYGVVGCVEPVSAGRSYTHSGALLLNLPSVLELTLFNGQHRHLKEQVAFRIESGNPTTFDRFEQFREAFQRQLTWVLDNAVLVNELLGRTHQDFYPTPILSALFEGPMERGQDLIFGGATINASGVAVVGLADVADSLAAMDLLVFQEHRLGMAEYLDALRENFHFDTPHPKDDPYRLLWERLMDSSRTPRFGNDDLCADRHAQWLVKTLHQTLAGRTNYRGGKYRVGYWTMTNHAGFSRFLGAMPNGRRGTFLDSHGDEHIDLFASGITPVSGVTNALTSMLQSVASLPAECIDNGMALNLKFTPETADRSVLLDDFVSATKGYFGIPPHGGMEIQFNVISHDQMIEAFECYRKGQATRQLEGLFETLLVRVSGYTAYFKDLTPLMQKEIINRSEYDARTGRAVKYPPFELGRGQDP